MVDCIYEKNTGDWNLEKLIWKKTWSITSQADHWHLLSPKTFGGEQQGLKTTLPAQYLCRAYMWSWTQHGSPMNRNACEM